MKSPARAHQWVAAWQVDNTSTLADDGQRRTTREKSEVAGSRRQEAARARLSSRRGETDSEVVDRALETVRESVERRDPPSDDEASRVVSEEMRQMRAEKRAKTFVTSPRR
jgi:hypothetical protein